MAILESGVHKRLRLRGKLNAEDPAIYSSIANQLLCYIQQKEGVEVQILRPVKNAKK